MNGDFGEASDLKLSFLPKEMICKRKAIVEESVTKVYTKMSPNPNKSFEMAVLGCSSGGTDDSSLAVVREILEPVHVASQRSGNKQRPVFEVILVDLPGSDFNALFGSLPGFQKSLERDDLVPCWIYGAPGNFYDRLFPDKSKHFIHSSYTLFWLTKVPEGLIGKKGEALNKESIYITSKSNPKVIKAYLDEFEKSFKLLLQRRSEEIVPGCSMVLTIMGRSANFNNIITQEIDKVLNDMVLEGVIKKENKVKQFNLPCYTPSESEVKKVIEEEGSFSLQKLESFTVNWDVGFNGNSKNERAKHMCNRIKAICEPIMVSEFGKEKANDLFERLVNKLAKENKDWPSLYFVISLTKNN